VTTLRAQTARQDSVRAAQLGQVIALQQRILDSLRYTRESLRQEYGQGMLEVQQQLVQIQELTGQSQRRLAELKRQLDDRSEQLAVATDTLGPAPERPAADTTAARRRYQGSRPISSTRPPPGACADPRGGAGWSGSSETYPT
jgi:septal ring factor EnvC (AmiA/AmiB activator)